MKANIGIWFLPIFLAVGAIASGCSDSTLPPELPTGDVELALGQEVYSNNCSRCHLNNGAGGSGVQLNEGKVVAKYPDMAAQRAIIVNGKGAMPGFSSLSDEEIDAVVRYTREVISEQ